MERCNNADRPDSIRSGDPVSGESGSVLPPAVCARAGRAFEWCPFSWGNRTTSVKDAVCIEKYI
ncbi:hypothetical protein [Microbaculum marinum]|uniref:hypothetical protein n=1 Tax=Microbaculum marinum TaxID=1764581 RepID=UPI0036733E0C